MSDPHGKMWYKNDKGKWVSVKVPSKGAKPVACDIPHPLDEQYPYTEIGWETDPKTGTLRYFTRVIPSME